MHIKLVRINNILLGLIILVNGYVLAAPFIPAVLFRVADHSAKRQQLTRQIHAAPPTTAAKPTSPPQPNQVIIPSMLLDTPIYEGQVSQQYQILDKGVWRWPRGSTPDRGGNTVLIGHRFTYTNPRGIFYYLNKVALGDEIGVVWAQKTYLYRVTSTQVVAANDTAIEAGTTDSRLTLFTCTPLWLPKDRLVVIASAEEATP